MKRWPLILSLLLTAVAPSVGADLPTELDEDRKPTTVTGGTAFITNATIITLGPAGTIENGSILIRDGKIAGVGRDLRPPAGVTVIDAQGGFVIPGIIDCHSHMAIERGVNEGSLSITAEVRIADVVNPDDTTIYRALAGGVTAAHLLHGSANTIGGQDEVIKLKYGRPVEEMRFPGAPQGIKFALGENVTRANSSQAPTRFPASRMGVEALLRRAFTEARAYQAEWDAYEQRRRSDPNALPPRRDLRLETLAGILKGDILVHAHSYRQDEILMLIRIAEEFGFRIKTFQHVLEGYKVAPEIAAHGAGGSTFSDWWAYKVEAYDAIPYNAALMAAAGVVTSLNSDSGELVRRLYHEAAKAMRYGGMSETEALKLVTLNPAKQLGIDHRVGSIETGKDADLAIFNGHPMSVYSRCQMTLVDGEVFFERRDALGVDSTTAPHVTRVSSRDDPLPPLPPTGRPIAIVGATIYPVSSPPIEGGTLLMQDGRIAAVGRQVSIPAGAVRLEARGLRVYPGLIDTGTQLGLTEIGSVRATSDNSEIGRLQPDLVTTRAIQPSSEHIPVARAAGITAAVSRPSGGLVSGQSAVIHLTGWTVEEMVVQSPWALHINFPAVPPAADAAARRQAQSRLDETLKEVRDLLQQARDYQQRKQDFARNGRPFTDTDPRLEALLPYVSGARPVVMDVGRPGEILAAIKFAEDEKLRLIISGGREAWKVADTLAAKQIPVLLGPVLATPATPYDPYDAPFANAALLHRAGVQFAFQTNDSSDVRTLPHHAGMSAAFGLPPDAALRALTLDSARILGVDDRVGSLDAGKVADVIVTDGDPLELTTQVRYMFIGGTPVSLESKHTRLYQEYRKRLQRLPRQ